MYKSLKIKNYKCFINDADYQGFDIIKPINVIIGKNNSGKSKLIEALKSVVEQEKVPFALKFTKPLLESDLSIVFPRNCFTHSYPILGPANQGNDWQNIGAYLVNKLATYEYNDNNCKLINIDMKQLLPIETNSILFKHLASMSQKDPFSEYSFLHLQAERDIHKEPINFSLPVSKLQINSNATGVTSLIARMLYDDNENQFHWQEYIENDFLNIINQIVAPEIKFTRILAKTNKSNTYEIYLEEQNKGGIKLSDCGSGIKTIIATLTLLHIIPHITNSKKFVIALEELENNMHPSLERKLLAHIKKYILENPEFLIFITTHSNVAIDLFGNCSDAQILKICNDGHKSVVEPVITDNAKRNLLDELGVKASDLLQTNCAIWVEGPSDRIYIKKWLELFNDGSNLEEGLHYQFIYYGGALLSHYSAQNNDLIDILKINKNSYVVMDSDKKASNSKLKERVAKIKQELPCAHWITKGKEIENYLPTEALTSYFGKSAQVEQFQLFPEVFKAHKKADFSNKVNFALEITKNSNYTKENLQKCLDLDVKIKELISFIRNSNLEYC